MQSTKQAITKHNNAMQKQKPMNENSENATPTKSAQNPILSFNFNPK
jgi:hypothetical protein